MVPDITHCNEASTQNSTSSNASFNWYVVDLKRTKYSHSRNYGNVNRSYKRTYDT